MSTYIDWSTDEVIHWLQNVLNLPSITPTLWVDLGINGIMLDTLLDNDGDELLKDELGIGSMIHRKTILNGIKRLKDEAHKSKNTGPNKVTP